MVPGARLALGVGAGYLLGRTKKMRLALMIAAAGVTGRTGTSPGALLQNGLKQLGSSAELGKLADVARDELLGAAKAAAVTAASSRITSLSDRLADGGSLRAGKSGKSEVDPDEDEDEDTAERGRENGQARDEDENGQARDEDVDEPERPVRRRAASGRGSGSSGRETSSRRGSSSSSRRTPVRRAGR
ncbi:MAG TPA: hypothetical protein VJ870_14825 [Amycolatopsis sp.]|nr:hypothetical protein [Amycolatopsis sp.]